MKHILAIVLLASGLAWGQRKDTTNKQVIGRVDASGAVLTKPNRVSSTVPTGSCSNANEVVQVGDALYTCSGGLWVVTNNSAVAAMIQSSTLGGLSEDVGKFGKWGSSGAAWKHIIQMHPVTFTNAPSVLSPGTCVLRDAKYGGTYASVWLRSYDPDVSANDVTGSSTVQFSHRLIGSGASWTVSGSAVLSGAASIEDTTLAGWYLTVPANSEVRVCLTASTGTKQLLVSARFH